MGRIVLRLGANCPNTPPKTVVIPKESNSAFVFIVNLMNSHQKSVKPRLTLESRSGMKRSSDREPSRLPLRSILRALKRKKSRKRLKKRLRNMAPMSSLLHDLVTNYKCWYVHFIRRSDSFFSKGFFCKRSKQLIGWKKPTSKCSDLMSYINLRMQYIETSQ